MNDMLLKRMKLLNWLLLVAAAYLAAELIVFEVFRARYAGAEAVRAIFPLSAGGNAWRAGYWASIAAIVVLIAQFLLGRFRVLKLRENGKLCYILFYGMMFLMLLAQNLWYGDVWLRYIVVVAVLLVSGFQGEYAKKLCTARTSRVR